MEKRIKRLEFGIIILVLLNILILLFQFAPREKKHVEIENPVEKELPREFNKEIQKRVVSEIEEAYNSNKYSELHQIFSEWAQVQISKETIEIEFSKLFKVTGIITDNAYSHYEYSGFESGGDWFNVFYTTKFENGIGTMKIKLRVIGANWEIVGINITLDEI